MTPTSAFLIDVAMAAALFMGIVGYVKRHLKALLIELCGTPERANFWLAFCNVTLVVVPLILALDYWPELGPDRSAIFEMATQIKHALLGFVVTSGALALVLLRFISTGKITPPTVRRD